MSDTTTQWETYEHPTHGPLSFYVYEDDANHRDPLPALYVAPGPLDDRGYPAGLYVSSSNPDKPGITFNGKNYTSSFRVEHNTNPHNPGILTSTTHWDYKIWTVSARQKFQALGRELHELLVTPERVHAYRVRVAESNVRYAEQKMAEATSDYTKACDALRAVLAEKEGN